MRALRLKYDSVVWDFDGVLVDSRAEAWRAASEILALLGTEVDIRSQETFRHYFTQGGTMRESDTAILRAMHRLVMQSRTQLLKPFPCLALVARLNVPAEIVTSGLATVARTVLGEHANLFVSIRGREIDSKDALLRTVSINAICVTDTVVDIARFHRQSRPAIAVGWGYDSIAALKSADPDFLVESMSQLEMLFEQLGLLKVA
jgi:phosphoglycolate phosphatase-like HAD superfamily hydrolase